MSDGLDITELEVFGDTLLNLAQEQFPRETKKFMQKQGNALNRSAKKLAKERVGVKGKSELEKPDDKRYLSGFKRGKVYKYEATNSTAVRVYNNRPHAHLIEYGHVQLDHGGKPAQNGEKFVKGRYVLRDARETFTPEYEQAAEDFIDDLLDKGMGL